jgi:hypothetical protein
MVNFSRFPDGWQHEFQIYIPNTFDVDGAISAEFRADLLVKVQVAFSQEFGGFTITEAVGGWVSANGQLVTEQVTIVSSSADEITPRRLRLVRQVALAVKHQLQQEAVSVRVDGTLFFF